LHGGAVAFGLPLNEQGWAAGPDPIVTFGGEAGTKGAACRSMSELSAAHERAVHWRIVPGKLALLRERWRKSGSLVNVELTGGPQIAYA